MARSGKKSSGSDSKPKVHVTATGGMYYEADELLRSPKVREAIKSMVGIASSDSNKRAPDASSEGSETSTDD